ncbi:MAG TPA: hypothetical protein VL069_09130 [Opitutus sp.]|nr:hypothetical protein [Opitutus sp.]
MRIHFVRRCVAVLLVVSFWTSSARALSVIAPTFPELVAEASTIVRGKVKAISSRKVAGARGEVIKTFVTFKVSSALKGAREAEEVTLAFLGGQVGDERLEVPGMPAFNVGAEDYLFVNAQNRICPLVGAMHGRYRLVTPQKAGRPYVARDDHAPLVQVSDVIKPMRDAGAVNGLSDATERALSAEEFEQRVRAEIAQPTRIQPTPTGDRP